MIPYGISKNKILKVVNSILPRNKAVREFGLVFVSVEKMIELNKKYRGQVRPTNVLSFKADASELGAGDVVICSKVVAEEAKTYGFTHKNWMTRLIVHGILHLVGYDHDTVTLQKQMEKLEKNVLSKLGIVFN